MDSLKHIKDRARNEREALGATSQGLLARLADRIWNEYQIELVAVDKRDFLQGSRGEVVPAEGCLYYDRSLDSDERALLEVVAHEYGHLVLHHEAFGASTEDLIRGSVFLESGASSLSRYSPRSREEAEASAFAAELICPAAEVFAMWQRQAAASASDLAASFNATPSLVRIQLAQGLFEQMVSDAEPEDDQPDELPTDEQELAATRCGVPVLVDAGPGTGKTKTLIRRIVYLLNEKGFAPEQILVLTFSNEAAEELRKRIRRVLGEDVANRLPSTTFHGFGVILLNTLGHHTGLTVDFSILDEVCQQELVSEILGYVECEALIDIKNPEQTANEVVRRLNFLKERLVGPGKLGEALKAWKPQADEQHAYVRAQALLRLFREYERVKRERQSVDFADLIQMPYELLAARPDLRERVQKEYPCVMVDEYQDVSRGTALLLQQLAGIHNPPWVVGDARQAIYRFRGAAPENVREFARDFPGAQLFPLSYNYRSAPEIISVLNSLATWLDDPKPHEPVPERWRPGRQVAAVGDPPVLLAAANSDSAERAGIVRRIESWLASGIRPEDIAVLARRNIDVRRIAIELQRNGIRAVTSGLLTAEGAGGDLCAVLTVVDRQEVLPRLVYACGRRRASAAILNDVSRELLASNAKTQTEHASKLSTSAQSIAAQVSGAVQELQKWAHSGDGWAVLCEFLFFLTPYLRDALSGSTDPTNAVQLEEIVSALSLAANYRFTHTHVRPRASRLGFAELLRTLVTESAPGLIPPRKRSGAVRVMTCHASKGLEFPCVALAGQSLAQVSQENPCLPPSLRPDSNEDVLQAESLLFVGVSRAEAGAVISYASSATGSSRSRPRRFPKLLTALQESGIVPTESWQMPATAPEEIMLGRIWGGRMPSQVSAYSLSESACRLRSYLEEQLGVRFDERMRPLYPEFISCVRRMLRRVIDLALETGRAVSQADALRIAEEEWPAERYQDHPHVGLYRPRAQRWTRALAQVLQPGAVQFTSGVEEVIEWQDPSGVAHTIRLQLIGHFLDPNGDRVAVALQMRAPDDQNECINWSALKDYERLPFVLLHETYGSVRPLVFCGETGEIRSFRWSARKPADAIHKEAAGAQRIFEALALGRFDAKISDWACDHCACRIICPWWVSATGDVSDPA